MANLVLNIGDGEIYKDGDILCAYNNKTILRTAAENVCCLRNKGFNKDGLRDTGLPMFDLLNNFMEFRFDRTGKREFRRTNLWTGAVSLHGDLIGDASVEQHVKYISTHKRPQDYPPRVFGLSGREIWFGGGSDFSLEKVGKVWECIEEKTHHRKADVNHRGFSDGELSGFFVVSAEDFSDEDQKELTSSVEWRDEGVLKFKKRKKLNFRKKLKLSSKSISKIDDKNIKNELPENTKHNVKKLVEDKI